MMNFKMNEKIPNEQECLQILKDYGTPEHVVRHCKEVCRVAVSIGERLNKKGYDINIPILRAAALLHDVARVHEHHEAVGEAYLRSIGYDKIAHLVGQHTHYKYFNPVYKIEEIDLLCIGDRTVIEDQFVGVDERLEYIKNKAIRIGRPDLAKHLDSAKKNLKKYVYTIEQVIGISLKDLMKG